MYAFFWLLSVLLVVIGETGNERWVGIYAGEEQIVYWAESLVILLTAVNVPLSLKLFSMVLLKKIDLLKISQALRLYRIWYGVRLCMLAVPMISGFIVYYMMLSNKGVLCALIALTASLFCVPGEKRTRSELRIDI